MRETLTQYCARYDRGELLLQWHPEKNAPLTPSEISCGSQKKIWWLCEHGHEWQSPPYARAARSAGCPYCAGKKVAPGQDLKSVFPQIAAQWHPLRNGRLGPEDCLPGSHRSVWWQCGHGHEWKALIKSRIEGSGCPVCSNRVVVPGKNDLATMAPTLVRQWHPSRNGTLRPDQVPGGSSRKVWWLCELGHEWQSPVHSRVKGHGCPVCTGKLVQAGENDLQSHAPELAKQWHPGKNGPLTPQQVTVGSNKRVWWQCSRGHEWQCAVAVRTSRNTGCPYCSNRKVLSGFNDLQTVEPLVAAQWHPTKNAPLEPDMVLPGSAKRVWWRCTDGHEWRAVIYSRAGADKCGCPVCAGKTPRQYK